MRLNCEQLEARETPAQLGGLTVADSIPVPASHWTAADFSDTIVPISTVGLVEWENAAAIADDVRTVPQAVREDVRAGGSGVQITAGKLVDDVPRLAAFKGEPFYESATGIAGRQGVAAAVSQRAPMRTATHEIAHTWAALNARPDLSAAWRAIATANPHTRGGYFATPIEAFAEYSSDLWHGIGVPDPVRVYLDAVYPD